MDAREAADRKTKGSSPVVGGGDAAEAKAENAPGQVSGRWRWISAADLRSLAHYFWMMYESRAAGSLSPRSIGRTFSHRATSRSAYRFTTLCIAYT